MPDRRVVVVVLALFAACRPAAPDVQELNGTPRSIFAAPGSATVIVFTRSDCPLSNRYSPELARLYHRYADRGVAFFLVYPDGRETAESIRAHLDAFGIPLTSLRDPSGALASYVGATTAPEAAVFDSGARLVYRGRIDDRFPELGVSRPPKRKNLQEAIESVLSNRSSDLVVTEAVGCSLLDVHAD